MAPPRKLITDALQPADDRRLRHATRRSAIFAERVLTIASDEQTERGLTDAEVCSALLMSTFDIMLGAGCSQTDVARWLAGLAESMAPHLHSNQHLN